MGKMLVMTVLTAFILVGCADGSETYTPAPSDDDETVPSLNYSLTDIKFPPPSIHEKIRACPTAIACNKHIMQLRKIDLEAIQQLITAPTKTPEGPSDEAEKEDEDSETLTQQVSLLPSMPVAFKPQK